MIPRQRMILFGVWCLATSLSTIARAENPTFRVTPDSLANLPLALEVRAGRRVQQETSVLSFDITIKAKLPEVPLAPSQRGILNVYDGKAFLAEVQLRPTKINGAWTYSFVIAKTALAKTSFVHSELFHEEFGGNHYLFQLQDFVPGK